MAQYNPYAANQGKNAFNSGNDEQGGYIPFDENTSGVYGNQQGDGAAPAPGAQPPTPGQPPTGDPRDRIRQYVNSQFAANGRQGTGAGSGPTDTEYYVDRISQEGGLDSGYDWAGRIARGINGTQPPLPGQGGGGGFGAGNFLSSFLQSGFNNPYGPQKNELINMLMGKAKQPTTVDPNDPAIRGQVAAADAQRQWSDRDALANIAEQAGPGANLQGEQRLMAERRGNASANLQSQLMTNELTAKRQEIAQSLGELGSILSPTDQLALQRQLGLLDAQIRQQALDSQNDQFAANYNLNSTDRANYWDALRSGLTNG
jgi:hypothetical protein